MTDLEILQEGIAAAVRRYQENPFDFLYEADLQALLFAVLKDRERGDVVSG